MQKMLADTRAKIEVFAERNGAWFVYPSPIHRQTPPQSLQGRPCLTSFLTTFSSLSPSTNIPASPLHPPRNQRPALHRYPHATRLLPLSSVPVTPSPTRLHSPSHASSPYLRTHHHSLTSLLSVPNFFLIAVHVKKVADLAGIAPVIALAGMIVAPHVPWVLLGTSPADSETPILLLILHSQCSMGLQ